ncbi:maleylpyruvate isomerase family mycothiol-dependent enzyme [Gordonia sp. VNK21]|uniref:maleylpyruvate isomerase family mycothiol-dependent enzyme n=1 Tax=Gordonia sp. VNK21 TaxID=3382483 RepID=UPI0038D4E16C
MATIVPRQPVVDALSAQWTTLIALASGLSDEQFAQQSVLPGWTIGDVFAHIAGTEWMLTGREVQASRDVSALEHVRNPIGELNEQWADHYRGRPREELLGDLRTVVGQRLAGLDEMTESQWDAEGPTPAGQDTYGRFMQIRVFDCWMHELDVRDSLGRGTPEDPLPATVARREMESSLPFLIGKRAQAPAGTAVTVEFTGCAPAAVHVTVADRAQTVPALDREPDVRLQVALPDYARLIGGRRDADPAAVRIDGDTALGERIVGSLHYTI